MGFTVGIDKAFVTVRFGDEFGMDDIVASRQKAAELVVERGLNRILVDFSSSRRAMSTTQIYEICSRHHEVLPPGVAVAVVYPPEVIASDAARFAETVSENRGVILRAFPELAVAKQWLKKGQWA